VRTWPADDNLSHEKGARLARELAQSPLTRVNRLHYAMKHALIG